jgi:toxin ParE1/3/4
LKRRTVTFTPEARNDLLHLGDWIAERAGVDVALNYIERLEAYCAGFETAGERGQQRDDIRLACALSASNDASPSPSPSPTSR